MLDQTRTRQNAQEAFRPRSLEAPPPSRTNFSVLSYAATIQRRQAKEDKAGEQARLDNLARAKDTVTMQKFMLT